MEQADTLIIPGWKGADVEVPAKICKAIGKAHERGCRLISICSGGFVLAASGMLDGRQATTHWRYTEALARMYDKIEVAPDVLYVEAGDNIYTSAGSAAGIDLCLHIIGLDYGAAVANLVAKRFVLPVHRAGGQAQYIDYQEPCARSNLSGLFEELRQRLGKPLSLADMADLAHMSSRTLIRHFKKTTGLSPQKWLIAERINRAKSLLETGSANIDQIAVDCGFQTPETFRHHFRALAGTSPSQYRNAFSRQTVSAKQS